MTENARLRASDAEREGAVERLRQHHADGRLDLEEFQSRMEAAYQATYVDELPPLLADLPAAPPSGETAGHREPPRRRLPVPVVAVVLLVLVATTVGAVTHGHPPFGLLWLAVAMAWFVSRRQPWRRGPTTGSRPGR